jgi:hypothetical protein
MRSDGQFFGVNFLLPSIQTCWSDLLAIDSAKTPTKTPNPNIAFCIAGLLSGARNPGIAEQARRLWRRRGGPYLDDPFFASSARSFSRAPARMCKRP